MLGQKVLHVDDNPPVTRLVARHLESHGFESTQVNDPARAMVELAQGGHRVVLLDLDMPRIDGMALLKQIQAYDASIRVIVLSALEGPNALLEARRKGAWSYLWKHVSNPATIINAVQEAFAHDERWNVLLNEWADRTQRADCLPAAGSVDELTRCEAEQILNDVMSEV